MGILRSGETYSEPFEELQIIKTELFELAQSLMTERTNSNKELEIFDSSDIATKKMIRCHRSRGGKHAYRFTKKQGF